MKTFCTILLLAFEVRAQAPPANQVRGKQVIDAALEALGGPRFLAMQDRTEEGRLYSYYRERLSGASRARIYMRYLTRPEPPLPGFFGQREHQSYGKDKSKDKNNKEDRAILFNEEGGYELTFKGASPLEGEIYARYKDSMQRNIFYILRQRLGEKGLIFEFLETGTFENLPVEVVTITDDDNRVVKVYFHRSTHFPLRQVFSRRNPLTRELNEEVTIYNKYRDVGNGVMWPYSLTRYRNGEKIFEMFSESVTINQGLLDNMFLIPSGMKVKEPGRR